MSPAQVAPFPKIFALRSKSLTFLFSNLVIEGQIGYQSNISEAAWAGDMNCYDFRRWAFNRLQIETIHHAIRRENAPKGMDFGNFLSRYAGVLALCDWYPVPKYFEVPLAGCVSFVQWHDEMEELGFKADINCVCVDKGNFDVVTWAFLEDPSKYQEVADSGRRLVESKYTAEKFADWLHARFTEILSRK